MGGGLRFAGDISVRCALAAGFVAALGTAGIALWALPKPPADEAAPAPDSLLRSPESIPIGGGIVVGALVTAISLRQRRAIRGPLAVAEAACAAAGGEADDAALRVDERFGSAAVAWNALADRIARSIAAQGSLAEPSSMPLVSGGGLGSSLAESLWIGLAAVDSSGRLTWLNGAAALLLATRRDAALGKPLSEFLPDERVTEAVTLAASGTRATRASVDVAAAGGDADAEATLRVSTRALPGGGALVLLEDVSQQKLAMLARDTFVAQATHELRTPLTNIRLYVDELIAEEEPTKEVRGRCLEVISSESRRLERMVSEMLSVSEMEAGTMKLHVDDVRTDALLADLEKDFKAQAEAKSIRLEFKLPPKLPTFTGDRDRIYMTLANLLGNAVKYTPAGGSVSLTLRATPSEVRFEIADTGIGIGENDQERIFESFYRARDPRVEKITGTGLGLSVARQIARLHGGDVTVSSVVDRGSTFTLALPAQRSVSLAA
ncbi:MAG: PAS domain-containing protein [Phycisphaerae bacterium]|nr:PAS domain-containing protein [Phycisphaerae bacterium]